MADSNDTRFAELKARTTALGFQLIRNTNEDGGDVYDYYVNDPESDRLCFTGSKEPERELVQFLESIEKHGVWWRKPAATADVAQTFSEYAESELANVKSILTEIDHLAHDGQQSDDPATTLS